jgi:hypothetical protein
MALKPNHHHDHDAPMKGLHNLQIKSLWPSQDWHKQEKAPEHPVGGFKKIKLKYCYSEYIEELFHDYSGIKFLIVYF